MKGQYSLNTTAREHVNNDDDTERDLAPLSPHIPSTMRQQPLENAEKLRDWKDNTYQSCPQTNQTQWENWVVA